MKLLRIFLSVLIIAQIISASSISASSKGYAQELITDKTMSGNQISVDPLANISYGTPSETIIPLGEQSITNVDWVTFHELANAFSYYTMRAQPLIYFPSTGELATIYRGSVDINFIYPNYTGINTLNNLFIRTSTDLGRTWGDSILVYDAKDLNFGNARYPSIEAVEYEGSTAFIFSSPLTQGTGWMGTVDGVYAEEMVVPFLADPYETTDPKGTYSWGTASNIVTKIGDDDYPMFVVSTSPRAQTGSEDPYYNNFMGVRKGTGVVEVHAIFPEEWSPDKYPEIQNWFSLQGDDKKAKNVTTSAMNYLSDGSIAQLFWGNYLADNYDGFIPAYSFSGDDGDTWTDFDILPYSLIEDFMSSQGANIDSINVSYGSSFVEHESGALSMAAIVNDAGSFIEPDEELVSKVIEIIYQDGEWAILEVADMDLIFINQFQTWNETNQAWEWATTQTGYELQIASTADKKFMLIKWLEVINMSNPDLPNATTSTDIMVAGKAMSSDQWGPKVNITNDEKLDRITWIPKIIPNDMVDIPIIEVLAKRNPDLSIEDAWMLQYRLIGTQQIPGQQEVKAGNFTYSTVDVEKGESEFGGLHIANIYPNPAQDDIEISFNLPENSSYELELYDLLGVRLETIKKGGYWPGLHSVRFNTSGLPTGSYYLMLSANGQRVSEMLNVIR